MRGPRALISYACGVFACLTSGQAAAQSAVPNPDPVTVPAGAASAPETFDIQAFDVSGVTKLAAGEVERLVYPHAGPGRTKDDVEAARKALQDAYAAKGFEAVVVDVPIQATDTFNQGIVQIAVSEVPVGRVRVTNSRYHALSVARAQIASLAEGKPVDFKALQADISAANRFPDRTIAPEFKPGKVPGTLDVDLKIDDQRPLHASVQIDNDNSPQTSPLRVTATARYTNLFQAGQTASLTYVVAPQRRKDTEVVAGSYTVPIMGSRWTVALSGYYSNSNIAALGSSNVLGKGYQFSLRAIYRLPSDKTVQTLSFGPDYKDFKQNIFVSGTQTSDAPIRYVPLNVQYAIAGASERSSYAISLAATFGLRLFNRVVCADAATVCIPVDQFQNREQNSLENFVHLNLSANYDLAFKNDFVASTKFSGQLADSHLITNEQFSAGGFQSVRGYYSAESVGDQGVTGGLELRSPSFSRLLGKWLTEARFYGFADGAYIHVIDTSVGQTANFKLVGVGGGLRLRILDMLSGDVLVAVPLIAGPVSKRGDPRFNFVVRGEF